MKNIEKKYKTFKYLNEIFHAKRSISISYNISIMMKISNVYPIKMYLINPNLL